MFHVTHIRYCIFVCLPHTFQTQFSCATIFAFWRKIRWKSNDRWDWLFRAIAIVNRIVSFFAWILQNPMDNKMSARVFDALITFPYVVESEAAKRFSAKICFNLFHALEFLLSFFLFFFFFFFDNKRFKRIARLNKFQAVGINYTFILEKAIVLPRFVLSYGVSCGRRRPSFVRSS